MNPNLTAIIEGRKFMWDGQVFDTRDECLRQAEAYQNDNFEVRLVEQEAKFFLYTRRAVKEVVASAS
jgi:hypothetical protein